MNLGKLFVIEGLDFSGKSSVVKNLVKNIPSLISAREPGGGKLPEALRHLMLTSGALKLETFLHLMMAARHESYGEIVWPNILAGNNVVLDRSLPSTWAYQISEDRGLRHLYYASANRVLEKDGITLKPIYFFLDVTVEIAEQRLRSVLDKAQTFADRVNHFDEDGTEAFRRRRLAYQEFMAMLPEGQGYTINADFSKEEVQSIVLSKVLTILNSK